MAGVSVATVSRVINRSSGVRPDTLKKVTDAIAYTGYIPNVIARNLKTDKTMMIGFIISNISNQHFTAMAKVIEEILWKHNYSLIVCSTEDDPQLELDYLYRLVGMRIDGLIINPTNQNSQYIADLSHSVPIVLVDRSISAPNFVGDLITSDNYSGMKTIVQHLLSCGHRNIGIINSSLQVSTYSDRLRGFSAAMREAGIAVDDHYPYSYDCQYLNEDGGAEGCKYLMGLDNPPTAIVVSNNTMALGVYKYLNMRGFKVPKDVSVASYGNIENSELFAVQPSYTTLNPLFLGNKAANHLLSRIEDPQKGNREVIFEPLLVLNDSIATI